MLSRRTFMISTVACALARPAMAQDGAIPLRIDASRHRIAPSEFPETELWTVNGQFPGQPLRLPQGARLRADLINDIAQPTSLHWHGIRIDNAMDGVPGLTQDAVMPGARFRYDFALPDAGTYWYHSHAQSVEQVERGLYGPLIVEESQPPDVDHDLTIMVDDIRLDRGAQVDAGFDSGMDRSHGGRIGNIVLANGMPEFGHPVRTGDRLRLRLINTANARIFTLGLQGLRGVSVALDGMPLARPQPVEDRLTLAPAQRIDLIVDVTARTGEDAFLISFERDGGYALATFGVTPGTVATRPAPAPLPPNPDFPITLNGARNVTLLMEGGAMGRMRSATLDGETRDARALAEANMFWALNGHVGRPKVPLIKVALGETVRIGMANDTAFPHAMHLHGMHFSEILAGGAFGPLRDTLLMRPGEAREIAFAAHNPGDWLLHCHMLSHHAAGMGTWVRVVA